MPRTRIKICGITRVEDALVAAHAGADAIGLVFYAPSPRAVSRDRAREICAATPSLVATVALFVNESPQVVTEVAEAVRPSLLQFHGDEDEAFCAQFGLPYLKAIRVGNAMRPSDLLECEARFHSAKGLLLDTLSSAVYGGSGETFDWKLVPPAMRSRIVLSGGLNPLNVANAIEQVRPWAVDVSSGVETVEKGIKDHRKIAQFIEAARNADAG
ncbi:MAG: phosphoribosylanthranilate isomerase [Betaproteobacteria bacterium]|nr:phosphoribosylanthranilate isomerase [Betaproteobacteria bacterium]